MANTSLSTRAFSDKPLVFCPASMYIARAPPSYCPVRVARESRARTKLHRLLIIPSSSDFITRSRDPNRAAPLRDVRITAPPPLGGPAMHVYIHLSISESCAEKITRCPKLIPRLACIPIHRAPIHRVRFVVVFLPRMILHRSN